MKTLKITLIMLIFVLLSANCSFAEESTILERFSSRIQRFIDPSEDDSFEEYADAKSFAVWLKGRTLSFRNSLVFREYGAYRNFYKKFLSVLSRFKDRKREAALIALNMLKEEVASIETLKEEVAKDLEALSSERELLDSEIKALQKDLDAMGIIYPAPVTPVYDNIVAYIGLELADIRDKIIPSLEQAIETFDIKSIKAVFDNEQLGLSLEDPSTVPSVMETIRSLAEYPRKRAENENKYIERYIDQLTELYNTNIKDFLNKANLTLNMLETEGAAVDDLKVEVAEYVEAWESRKQELDVEINELIKKLEDAGTGIIIPTRAVPLAGLSIIAPSVTFDELVDTIIPALREAIETKDIGAINDLFADEDLGISLDDPDNVPGFIDNIKLNAEYPRMIAKTEKNSYEEYRELLIKLYQEYADEMVEKAGVALNMLETEVASIETLKEEVAKDLEALSSERELLDSEIKALQKDLDAMGIIYPAPVTPIYDNIVAYIGLELADIRDKIIPSLEQAIETFDIKSIKAVFDNEQLGLSLEDPSTVPSVMETIRSLAEYPRKRAENENKYIERYIYQLTELYSNHLVELANEKIADHENNLVKMTEKGKELHGAANKYSEMYSEYNKAFSALPEGHSFTPLIFPMPNIYIPLMEAEDKTMAEIVVLKNAIEEADWQAIKEHLFVMIPEVEGVFNSFDAFLKLYKGYIGKLSIEIVAIKEYLEDNGPIELAENKIKEHQENLKKINEKTGEMKAASEKFDEVLAIYDELYSGLPEDHPFNKMFLELPNLAIPSGLAKEKTNSEIGILQKAIEEMDFDAIKEHIEVNVEEVDMALNAYDSYKGIYESYIAKASFEIEKIKAYKGRGNGSGIIRRRKKLYFVKYYESKGAIVTIINGKYFVDNGNGTTSVITDKNMVTYENDDPVLEELLKDSKSGMGKGGSGGTPVDAPSIEPVEKEPGSGDQGSTGKIIKRKSSTDAVASNEFQDELDSKTASFQKNSGTISPTMAGGGSVTKNSSMMKRK